MSHYRPRLLVVALLVAVAADLMTVRFVTRQRRELQRLHARNDELTHERDDVLRQSVHAQNALSAAERRVADEAADVAAPTPSHAPEVRAWLERLRKIRARLNDDPRQQIPQLQLLTDDDWLRVASRVQFDSAEHVRQALAMVRTAAKDKFQRLLGAALTRYCKQNNSALPATVYALAPFFDAPVDPAILGQYEMVPRGSPSDRTKPAIQESAAVDPDYDTRWETFANGGAGRTNAPAAWLPDWDDRSRQASTAYRAANHGRYPGGIEDMIPYFNPPLEPTLAARLIQATHENP